VADDLEGARREDHVHALSLQVARLVEAVFLRAGPLDLSDDAEQGSLRRGPTRRKIEARALSGRLVAESQHSHGHPHLEGAPPCRARYLDQCGPGATDLLLQVAVVQRLEAEASPPPPGEKESRSEEDRATALLAQADGSEDECCETDQKGR
jgi:hypothetical protein